MFKKETMLNAFNQWHSYNEAALDNLRKASPEHMDVTQITLMQVISNVRYLACMAGEVEEFDKKCAEFKPAGESMKDVQDFAISVCEWAITENTRLINKFEQDE